MILSLKDLFKDRKLSNQEVVESFDNIADCVTVDLLKGVSIDAAQVALVSNVMHIANNYKNKKFAIDLMKGALAELESDHFRERGGKLS